jgi:hypothetical protein
MIRHSPSNDASTQCGSEMMAFCTPSACANVTDPMTSLDVEPQQVVLGEAEAADGWSRLECAVGSMPVVSMQPDGEFFGALM